MSISWNPKLDQRYYVAWAKMQGKQPSFYQNKVIYHDYFKYVQYKPGFEKILKQEPIERYGTVVCVLTYKTQDPKDQKFKLDSAGMIQFKLTPWIFNRSKWREIKDQFPPSYNFDFFLKPFKKEVQTKDGLKSYPSWHIVPCDHNLIYQTLNQPTKFLTQKIPVVRDFAKSVVNWQEHQKKTIQEEIGLKYEQVRDLVLGRDFSAEDLQTQLKFREKNQKQLKEIETIQPEDVSLFD